jgi:hypothetical protein
MLRIFALSPTRAFKPSPVLVGRLFSSFEAASSQDDNKDNKENTTEEDSPPPAYKHITFPCGNGHLQTARVLKIDKQFVAVEKPHNVLR